MTDSLPGKIESVNGAMLSSLLEEESDLVVFMFREDNRSGGRLVNIIVFLMFLIILSITSIIISVCPRLDEAVLYTMDDLDKALDKEDIKMVSINEKGIEKDYGLSGLPLLIHFNGNIPRVFEG